jgi:Helix-turn-helix domain
MTVMEYAQGRPIGDILKERNIEIIGADPVTRHGFTQVPNFILTKKEISVGAKLAYAMLLKYAWDNDACFPGQVKLAEDMGAGERSVRTYLKELEAAGLLEITQRGLGKTNLYRLFLTVKKGSGRRPDRQNSPV